MKFCEAKKIIFEGVKPRGYRVSFERIEGAFLTSDQFPDRDEEPFEHEEEAWQWASQFAAATYGKNVNIYVVDDQWHPVTGYERRKINNRPPEGA